MWKKNDEERPQSSGQPSPPPRPAAEPRRGGNRAVLGESIRIQGEITGSEDLLIEGEVEGRVDLPEQSVTVGRSGRVKADIHGKTLIVEGRVQGNLFSSEQVAVRSSGEVRGNITSPRVTLEDGAKFKGSIDMEPNQGAAAGKAKSEAHGGTGDDKGREQKGKDGKGTDGKAGAGAPGAAPGAGAAQQTLAAKGSGGA